MDRLPDKDSVARCRAMARRIGDRELARELGDGVGLSTAMTLHCGALSELVSSTSWTWP